ncbi:MAG: hypothetical protein JRI34_02580, partial [Deltaproteobacteria bacterium]|nr:hypothetical protein [Deltaproteobacteria bacterium]
MHQNPSWKLCVLFVCLVMLFGGCARRPLKSNPDYLALENKVSRMERDTFQEIRQIQEKLNRQQEGIEKLKAVKVQPAPAASPALRPKKNIETLYPEALSQYYRKDYAEATKAFQYLVDNYVDHKLTPNAVY